MPEDSMMGLLLTAQIATTSIVKKLVERENSLQREEDAPYCIICKGVGEHDGDCEYRTICDIMEIIDSLPDPDEEPSND